MTDTKVCLSASGSLGRGGCEVECVSDALPYFLEPSLGIRAVNHTPKKAKLLRGIVAVLPNVVLGDLGV